ncbi:protein-disulfide isomerase [Vibrio neptunius]|uniref:DsbA family protein n=1 Tax=Vibrio neptunius TaxID=170651 RepID=UPI0005FA749B|nr:DsbA family protein [Vibrio neptunius]KJY89924.1 protein-disulfide isomerase [Vibrio neptunius]
MIKKLTIALAMGVMALSPLAQAQNQDEKINEIVEMLKANPGVVNGLHESLGMYVKQQQQFDQLLSSSQAYINDPKHTSIGAENAELTLVNVTDYSCPYCKKLDLELQKLVKDYPQIKVVNLYVPLKEGSSSVNSAGYALNVWQNARDKYPQVHEFLVAKPGTHDAISLAKIAKKTGTEQYLNNPEDIEKQLENNYALFNGFGLRGTPALIVGESVIPGYVPYDKLEEIIEKQL